MIRKLKKSKGFREGKSQGRKTNGFLVTFKIFNEKELKLVEMIH